MGAFWLETVGISLVCNGDLLTVWGGVRVAADGDLFGHVWVLGIRVVQVSFFLGGDTVASHVSESIFSVTLVGLVFDFIIIGETKKLLQLVKCLLRHFSNHDKSASFSCTLHIHS